MGGRTFQAEGLSCPLRSRLSPQQVFGVASLPCTGAMRCPSQATTGSDSQYRAIALWINDHSTVQSYLLSGELGVIQYYSRAEAVSDFSDRQILVTKMRDESSKLPTWLRRANIHFLQLPGAPSGAEFRGDCVPGKVYDHTWITQGPWTGDHLWCWSADTRPQANTQPSR